MEEFTLMLSMGVLVTMWELPTFDTIKEAWIVLKDLARQGINVQHVSARRNATKRRDRTQINEMIDEFIALTNSYAQDADAVNLTKLRDDWLKIRAAAESKRKSLIISKEKIADMDKLW